MPEKYPEWISLRPTYTRVPVSMLVRLTKTRIVVRAPWTPETSGEVVYVLRDLEWVNLDTSSRLYSISLPQKIPSGAVGSSAVMQRLQKTQE